MKKKSLVMTVAALAAFTSIASAAPATSWEQGQWQVDLGASDPKAKFDGLESDTKWNFNGGLGYALSDKWALRYDYHGLKTEAGDFKTAGDENEVNLMYSLGRNAALFAGWARINNDFDGSVARGTYGIDSSDSVVNNVAQFGAIVKADLAKNLALYAEGALGTKKTSMWEAGLSYTIAKDWDLNAGYRYLDTKLDDDNNIKYRGFLVGLTYRFGGHKAEAAPVVEEPAPVVEEPVQEPAHVYNDYYLDSIHFASDASDAYNEDLSKRRVDHVAQYVSNNGVSSDRLKLNYKGEKDPVASNATEQGKADNRRVDVWEHK